MPAICQSDLPLRLDSRVFAFCLVLGCLVLAWGSPLRAAESHDRRAFELRIYTAEDGKLEDLQRRFRDHTVRLFEKHGMTVIGFWTPTEGVEATNTLVYVLAYPSAKARAASWKAFVNDPDWKKVYTESQKNGQLVKKVESKMMAPTDYSPLQ